MGKTKDAVSILHARYAKGAAREAALQDARNADTVERAIDVLQRVADFDFMDKLDASPSPSARESYTQLMVEVRLALRDLKHTQETSRG